MVFQVKALLGIMPNHSFIRDYFQLEELLPKIRDLGGDAGAWSVLKILNASGDPLVVFGALARGASSEFSSSCQPWLAKSFSAAPRKRNTPPGPRTCFFVLGVVVGNPFSRRLIGNPYSPAQENPLLPPLGKNASASARLHVLPQDIVGQKSSCHEEVDADVDNVDPKIFKPWSSGSRKDRQKVNRSPFKP